MATSKTEEILFPPPGQNETAAWDINKLSNNQNKDNALFYRVVDYVIWSGLYSPVYYIINTISERG